MAPTATRPAPAGRGDDLVLRAGVVGHGTLRAKRTAQWPAAVGSVPRVERGEQRQAVHALDLRQHLGHRGLRERQKLRSPPKMAELIQRHQQLQVLAQPQDGTQRAVGLGHDKTFQNGKKSVQLFIGIS